MKTVGQKLDPFRVTGVKPGFNQHEENGVSAFETITEKSFPGKWKVIYFYPKDFTFVCPTEIVGFARLASDFEDRDAVAVRRIDRQRVRQARLAARSQGSRTPATGVRRHDGRVGRHARHPRPGEGVALRATFIVDPDNVVQHVSRQQPERRPQPRGSAARARRSADRRAVPMQSRGGPGDAAIGNATAH